MMNKIKGRSWNASTLFLLPALGINRIQEAEFTRFGFIDCYLFCDKCEQYDGIIPLYLFFKPKILTAEFNKFCNQLERNANYVATQDVPGGLVFIFSIPQKYHKDYRKFLKGQYSKFSDEYKSCFDQTLFVEDEKGNYKRDSDGKYITEYTDFYHIFNRTEELREVRKEELGLNDDDLPEDLELCSIYNKDLETLKIE